ncbi:MAG TPA: ABC transporter substrate-binding protein [Burkholderiaceae bacterium]
MKPSAPDLPFLAVAARPGADRAALFVLVVLALAACQPREPIKVGFVAGLSGRAADLGISERNGAQLAVDDANAAGGIDGRTITFIVRDDEQKPELTARAVSELADGGVDFVIGPMTSSTAVAAATVANQRKVVMISPAGTTHELTGKADFFFRCIADAPAAARQHADFLYDRGRRALAVLGDQNNRAFVDSYSAALTGRFVERGGKVVISASFQSGAETRFTELARQLLAVQPDAAMVIASAVDTALLAQNLRKLDTQVLITTTPWAGTEELIQLGGRALEGAFVPQYFDRDSRAEAFVSFSRRYRQRFGEDPGFPATIAHDAVTMGLAALRERNKGQTLRDALVARSEYPGLQRPTRIDRNGDGSNDIYMTAVENGRYRVVGR